jgi:hypothetical protein
MGAVLVVGFPGAAACTGGAVIEPGTTSAAKRRRDRTVRRRGLLVVRAGSSINTRHTRRVYPRRYPARCRGILSLLLRKLEGIPWSGTPTPLCWSSLWIQGACDLVILHIRVFRHQ